MIPLFWRFFLFSYFNVFSLCIGGFIAILLVSRSHEVAHFFVLSSHWYDVFLFTSYQIPNILPFAIPISSLISSLVLFQKLSSSHTLTALRISGLSLKKIVSPVLFASLVLFSFHLFFAAEITPRCHFLSKKLFYEQTAKNPLLALNKKTVEKTFVISLCDFLDQASAKNLFLIFKNQKTEQLQLIFTQTLQMKNEHLLGKNFTFVSHLKNDPESLLLENQENLNFSLDEFLKKPTKTFSAHKPNTLSSKELLCQRFQKSFLLEIFYRISLALSTFTFTILGIGFGIHLNKKLSKKTLLFPVFLALLTFVSLLTGRSLHNHFLPAFAFHVLSPLPSLIFALHRLRKIAKGISI